MSRRLVVLALLVLTAGGCSAGGTSGSYRVDALFDNASFLIPGQDVRVAGAIVGTVTGVSVTPDQKARISMRIDRRFAPFRSDADCFIAPQSLIGERFIQCAPGTPRGRELPATGGHPPTVPLANTHSPVDPDLVTASFTLPVRERLSIILNELGAGLGGNGDALSGAIRRANPAIDATRQVLRIVDRDRATLGRLIDRSDQVVAQLAGRRDRVASFIREAASVSQTAARRDGPISDGLRRLPATLDETRASLGALQTLAGRSRPLLTNLQGAARPLDRLVGDTPALATAALPALRHLASMSRTGTAALRDGAPVVSRLRAFARLGVPAGVLVTQLNESLRDRGVVEGIQSFVYNVALAISRYDKDSHILPSYPVAPPGCVAYAKTTTPSCDAHFVKGSADAASRARPRGRRHRARPGAKPAPQGPAANGAPAPAKRPGDVPKGVVDAITGALDKLTRVPPPKLPQAPAPPPPPSDVKGVLDYLLGS
jgi:virulence factor Mce-like protein